MYYCNDLIAPISVLYFTNIQKKSQSLYTVKLYIGAINQQSINNEF